MSDNRVLELAQPAQLGWHKKLLFVMVRVVTLGFVVLFFGELCLRVLSLFPTSFRSSPFRRYDPVLGISLIPNKRVHHEIGCFHGEVAVNRWGMRDRDRSLEKSPSEFRIALIGDSLVEGAQVKSEEVMNIRMEKLLAEKGYGNVEVLNFSVEGIGTTQEYMMYRDQVRRFHPDVVILAFVSNDVMNNSSTLQPKCYGIHTWYCPYYDLGPDGNLVFRPTEARPLNGLRSFVEEHSLLAHYLERSWFKLVNPTLYTWDGVYLGYEAYADSLDTEWERAYEVTEKVLTLFKITVVADGAKFVVMVPPQFYQTDLNWRESFTREEGKVPASFSVTAYDERLRRIADRNDINMDSLAPYFVSYRETHHLQPPYYTFFCNQHYSRLGHEVAAEAMVQKLEERDWLSPTVDNDK